MGDLRFERYLHDLTASRDAVKAIHEYRDQDLVAALAAASTQSPDPYLANVLATELLNRIERKSTILETAAEGVLATDENGILMFMNPAAEQILGWTQAEFAGRRVHDVVHPTNAKGESVGFEDCPLTAPLRGGSAFRDRSDTLLAKDGHWFPVVVSGSPIVRDDEVLGVVYVFRDATERQEAAARLQESEERYRSLFQYHPDAIFSMDAEARFLEFNPGAERISGYRASELIGQPFMPLVDPDDLETTITAYERVLAGDSAAIEIRILRKDGARRRIGITAMPMVVSGDIVGVHAVAKDVTAVRESEEALQRGEAEFRALAENAPDIIVRFDRAHRHVYVNPAVERATGRPAAEFLGKSNRELGMPESLVAQWENAIERVFETGTEGRLSFEFPAPEGPRSFEGRFVPEHGANGKITHVLGISRDITEQAAAERRANDSLKRLETIARASRAVSDADTSADAVVDALATIAAEAFDGACAIRRLTEDRQHLRVAALHHPNDETRRVLMELKGLLFDRGDGLSARVLETGEPQLVPKVDVEKLKPLFDRAHQSYLDRIPIHSLAVVPLRMGTDLIGTLAVTRDKEGQPFTPDDMDLLQTLADRAALAMERARLFEVEKRAREQAEAAEAEVRRLNADLEERVRERTHALAEANRELEAFGHSVSHDLRGPLRGIGYLAQALLEDYGDALDEPGREHVRRLQGEAVRLSGLVNDLLAFSRASRSDIRKQDVDLSALARTVVRSLAAEDPDRSVRVDVQDGLQAHGDPQLLRVVLENVLGNAWKFTSGVADPAIRFEARDAGDAVEFVVSDNGVGIDPTKTREAFTPFRRLHADAFEGTGLGLSTVQRIVKRHGGDVWMTGAPGEGATVHFTLGAR